MKKIDITKMIKDNDLYYSERLEVLGMEFIKLKDGNYMIKDSNGYIVNEKEKLQLENKEMIIKDFESNTCQENNTKKIKKNNKRIKELMEKEKEFIPVETMDENERIEKTESTKK